jgi:muramidase (phage lysozyme)
MLMPELTQQIKAGLDTIAVSEIGKELLKLSDDGYDVLVGATAASPLLFDGYADHPKIYNTALNSTAAGRYQILYRFWPYYKRVLSLPDFSPRSQDLVALKLIIECGALDDLQAGDIRSFLFKCRSRWASLPQAGYGQHENKLEDLLLAFQASGGVLKSTDLAMIQGEPTA